MKITFHQLFTHLPWEIFVKPFLLKPILHFRYYCLYINTSNINELLNVRSQNFSSVFMKCQNRPTQAFTSLHHKQIITTTIIQKTYVLGLACACVFALLLQDPHLNQLKSKTQMFLHWFSKAKHDLHYFANIPQFTQRCLQPAPWIPGERLNDASRK